MYVWNLSKLSISNVPNGSLHILNYSDERENKKISHKTKKTTFSVDVFLSHKKKVSEENI